MPVGAHPSLRRALWPAVLVVMAVVGLPARARPSLRRAPCRSHRLGVRTHNTYIYTLINDTMFARPPYHEY